MTSAPATPASHPTPSSGPGRPTPPDTSPPIPHPAGPSNGAPSERAGARHHTPRLARRLTRPALAVVAGLGLYLAFPPVGLWPLAPFAVAALTLLVADRGLRASYGLGLLFGLAFFLPLLRFVNFVGADGWIVLSLGEAAILALVAPASTLVWRLPGSWAWIGAVWVGQEALRGRAPFGGFPWGRLAFSQPDSPFTPLAALAGAPAVTLAIAVVGALTAHVLLAAHRARSATERPAHPTLRRVPSGVRARAIPIAVPAAGAAALTLAGLAVPTPTGAQAGTLQVAAIQGNVPEAGGYDALGEAFQVTANHVAGTEALAVAVRAGDTPQPDLVLWPENSSDIDPLAVPAAANALTRAARAADAPLLVGAVLDGPGDGYVRNAGLIWTDNGPTGDMYVKRHPVPFAEYLPGRATLERMISRFAEEMPNDFLHGAEPGILPVAGTVIGDVICFEVAYDGLVRDSVERGATLLVVQTNNASFGRKGESEQQLAMSRLRAVEHGRATVQVSTSGQSAIITPDGAVHSATGLYESGILSAALPLRTGLTLATRLGATPEAVTAALGALAMMAGLARSRRSRRTAAGESTSHRGAPGSTADEERKGVQEHRVVVCVPTYNERESLPDTARRLRSANPAVDLLVIDDASPDGTGHLADELAADDPHVHVLHRTEKAGLGTAYVTGFNWALRHGYDIIVEMDADGSHQPEQLHRLLDALTDADVVIGSRWVDGGKVHNWPRRRLVLSRGANAYVRAALGVPLRDATAGYRAYRADVLRARDLDQVASQGYCFQVDLAWRAWQAGFRVVEVPITFVEREHGTSKMSRAIITEALWRVGWWALTTPRRRPTGREDDPNDPSLPPHHSHSARV